jgi:hypothetical protein
MNSAFDTDINLNDDRPIYYSKVRTVIEFIPKDSDQVFSDEISFKGQIKGIGEIYNKLNKIVNLGDGWNGDETFAPDGIALQKSIDLINTYQNFLEKYHEESAYVYLSPLNSGGIEIGLQTENFALEFESPNMNDTIQDNIMYRYLLTDDNCFEEENVIYEHLDFRALIQRLFLKLHTKATNK